MSKARTFYYLSMVSVYFVMAVYPVIPQDHQHQLVLNGAPPQIGGASDSSSDTAIKDDDDPAQKTILFNLRRIDCPEGEGKAIQQFLIKRIKSLPNVRLIQTDTVTAILAAQQKPPDCYNAACAADYGRIIGAHRVIIGAIRVFSRYTEEQLSDTGARQYIKQTRKEDYCRISMSLIDGTTGGTLVTREEEVRLADAQTAIIKITASLKEYFPPRIIHRKEEIVEEKVRLQPSIALLGSGMYPHGRFGSITTAAGGMSFMVGLHNLFVKNTALFINGSYYFGSQTVGDVTSFTSGLVSLHGGYSFNLPRSFFVTPILGVGYHFHSIKDAYTPKQMYMDPVISIKCMVGYTIYKGLSVLTIPGYAVFFEKGYVGTYVGLDGGVRYTF